jgi:N utilization substance protein B
MKGERRIARELVVRILYEWDASPVHVDEILRRTLNAVPLASNNREYVEKTVKGVVENQREIDKRIAAGSRNWRIERIARMDLAVLRLSVYEVLFSQEVNPAIASNEAVLLAKMYGTAESAKFINGIVGGIIRSLKRKPAGR